MPFGKTKFKCIISFWKMTKELYPLGNQLEIELDFWNFEHNLTYALLLRFLSLKVGVIYFFGKGLKICIFLEKQLKIYFAAKIWHTNKSVLYSEKKLGSYLFS